MSEKEIFSQRRDHQLQWPNRIKEIERWGKYCYVPLDIPLFNEQKFINYFFERAKPITKLKPDIASPVSGKSNFDSVDVEFDNQMPGLGIWGDNFQNDFLDNFQDFYDRVMEYFPFRAISKFSFWSSNTEVRYHRDHSRFTDNPSSFRIMLHDENPTQTLGIVETLPDQLLNPDNKFMIPRLAETNSFAWNNLRIKHGSTFTYKHRKILLILDRYELDIDRYHDLMRRSVEKYADHLLVSNLDVTDFVNL
jgi:hypothetical protein